MAGFIYFTEEQKRRANEVNLESFLLRQGERLLKSGREKRLASDHSITVRGNQWYDHAIEKGGGAIDFVKMFYGKDFPDAFPAGNAALFFLPEPCVPDIRGATGRSAFPQRRGRCAFFMVKGMDLLVCRKHAV